MCFSAAVAHLKCLKGLCCTLGETIFGFNKWLFELTLPSYQHNAIWTSPSSLAPNGIFPRELHHWIFTSHHFVEANHSCI